MARDGVNNDKLAMVLGNCSCEVSCEKREIAGGMIWFLRSYISSG